MTEANKLAARVRDRLGDGFVVSPGVYHSIILIEERFGGPNPFASNIFTRMLDTHNLRRHFNLSMKFLELEYEIFKWLRKHRLV